MRRRMILLCILASAFLVAPTCWAKSFPDRYDQRIERAAETLLPVPSAAFGWQILKAQYFQESRLDPTAVSPVGAAGVAQFMPGTWSDVMRAMGLSGVSPHDARIAIDAGAWYMAKLRSSWTAERPEVDRHSLALASYNAGFGHLLKAQREAGGVPDYARIIRALPSVTGHHATETTNYVTRIWRYWRDMRLWAP